MTSTTSMTAAMRLILDSDICIDAISRRDMSQIEAMKTTKPERLAMSVVTYGEVQQGVLYSNRAVADKAQWRRVLSGIELLSVTREVADVWAQIRGLLKSRGQLIGDNDTFIAATALGHGMTLVTRNYRHFARVPGLSILVPAF